MLAIANCAIILNHVTYVILVTLLQMTINVNNQVPVTKFQIVAHVQVYCNKKNFKDCL